MSVGNFPGSLGMPASGCPGLGQLALPGGPSPARRMHRCCCCLRPLCSVTIHGPEFSARSHRAKFTHLLLLHSQDAHLSHCCWLLPITSPVSCCLPSGKGETCLDLISLPRHLPPQGTAANSVITMHLISIAPFKTLGLTWLPIP